MGMQVERFVSSPYALYKKKPVSDLCENGFVEYFYSKNDPRNGVLEFVVEGNFDHLIVPCKTFLKLSLELHGKNKTGDKTVAEGADVSVINNIFGSLFESVEVQVSGQNITKTDKLIPYSAYLQNLCNYGEEALETYFEICGWAKDTAGAMDDTSGDNNNGLKKRREYFNLDKNTRGEFIGKLCSPLFFQEKVLPTQVSLRILLQKASDKFLMMHEEGHFELKIVDAVLMVQKVSVITHLQQSYLKLLEEDHPIPYFLRTPTVNYYTIERYSSQFMRDDLFQGRVPRRIVIGLVETDAYQGKRDKNPFNFQDFGLTEICLYKDGIPYPRPMLRMDFQKNVSVDAYHNFMSSINGAYTRNVPRLTKHDFMNGFALFSYDMSPDQMGSVHPGTMLNMNSNIRVEMRFKEPLTKNITLLVYSETDHLMEINRDRRVTINL